MRDKPVYHVVTISGEDIFVVDDVTDILYHEPCGEGDRHYVDVRYKDGRVRRIFGLNDVYLRGGARDDERVCKGCG